MYRALFERSSDAILIADVETKRFRYANSAASRLLGYAETELHTMGFADIHPTDAANDTNLLERVVQSGFALIRKPLTPGALLRKVQEVFTRSAAPS
jgi:PAS domain S-box-containing protein